MTFGPQKLTQKLTHPLYGHCWAEYISGKNDRRLGQHRGVAQSGSAPALGAGGREFKSRRPD